MPPFSLLIPCANLALIKALRGETWYSSMYKDAVKGWRCFVGTEEREPHETAIYNDAPHLS